MDKDQTWLRSLNESQRWPVAVFTLLRNWLPVLPYAYTGEHKPCDLCGSDNAHVIATWDRNLKPLRTVCCTKCGLVRTDPMPTEEELFRFYRTQYRFVGQLAVDRPPAIHIAKGREEAARRRRLLAPVLCDRSPGKILDFGAGSGEFLASMKQEGWEAIGIEPGSAYATFAAREYGLEIVSKPYTEVGFEAATFDVITAHHVIEHLRSPSSALACISLWLKADGIVYLSVPDITDSGKPTFERFHFNHTHNFAPETLEMVALKAGLEPDPRFPNWVTTRVFRKSTRPVCTWFVYPEASLRIIAALPPVSVAKHIISGAWAVPMLRRVLKFRRQSRATKQ